MGSEPREVRVSGDINLGQLLKAADLVGSGGEAKIVIGEGEVLVNGEVETRRGRRLEEGDLVQTAGETVLVTKESVGRGG